MKIAIFSDSFLPTVDGAVMSIKNSTRILSKENKIYLFIPSGSVKPPLNNIKYIELKSHEIGSYREYKARFPSFLRCYLELKKIKPDIVHLESIFGIAWEGLIAAKLLGIPIILTAHTIFPGTTGEISLFGIQESKYFKKFLWKYMNFFLNLCNLIITPSETIKQELIKHNVKTPIQVISNGINTKLFTFYKRKNKKEVTALYVGRLVSSKHVDVILKAFKLVLQEKIMSNLWIVGRGPEEKRLREYVNKNKLEESIKLFGCIENSKLPEIYKKADILVTASTIETEGITILEGMSTGLPVVGVDARAIPLLIKKDVGFIAKPYNEKEIAEFIIKLAKNYKLRLKLGKNASKKAEEYELEKVVSDLYKGYQSLINKFNNN